MNNQGPVGCWRCVVKEAWPFCTWFTAKRGESDLIRGVLQSICIIMVACWSARKAHWDHLSIRQERGRQRISICGMLAAYIAVFRWLFTTYDVQE